MLQLCGERGQLCVVRVLDVARAHNGLEELPLQNDLRGRVDVFELNAQLFVEICGVFFSFGELELVPAFFLQLEIVLLLLTVQVVELGSFESSEQREVVFLAFHVDAVELSECRVRACNVSVAQESPNLAKRQTEAFFALRGFDFAGVVAVPVLKL